MTDLAHYPVLDRLIDRVTESLAKHRRRMALRELDALGYDASVIARDLGLTRSQLRALVVQEPGFPGHLKRMLNALGLDPELTSVDPALSRDMQSVCSICTSKRRCHRELGRGTAARNFETFCANATNLKELSASEAPLSTSREFCPNPNLII
jgi:hypothetical protein